MAPRPGSTALALAFFLTACAGGMEPPPSAPATLPPPGSSILAFIDPGDRELAVGEAVEGALSADDYTLTDGRRIEVWRLAGAAGDFVSVDLVSNAFDAFLHVVGPGLDGSLTDDDSGGGCNARVSFTFPESADYLVVAQALSMEGTGPYTLRANASVAEPVDAPCDVNRIRLRDVMAGEPRGTLGPDEATESRLVWDATMEAMGISGDVWELVARPGTTVTIDLRSDAFDAYMYVDGPGLESLLEDDDSGGQCHSRVTVDITSSEPYTIVASGLDPAAEGRYTLITSTDPEPPVPGDCGGMGGALALENVALEETTLTVPGVIEDNLSFGDHVLADDSYVRGYGLEGPAGACVVLELSSDEFDTVLMVMLPGFDDPMSDDDGGEGTNSRMRITLPAGPAQVYATSFGSGVTGPFRLAARPCDGGP